MRCWETSVAHADLIALACSWRSKPGGRKGEVSPSRLDSLDATMRDVLLRCVPTLGPRAQDFAHTLVSLVVTAGAAKAPLAPEDLWRQAGPVVRTYLLDAGVDDARFCEVFAS